MRRQGIVLGENGEKSEKGPPTRMYAPGDDMYAEQHCGVQKFFLDNNVPSPVVSTPLYLAHVHLSLSKAVQQWTLRDGAESVFGTNKLIKIYSIACVTWKATAEVYFKFVGSDLNELNRLDYFYADRPKILVADVFPEAQEMCASRFYCHVLKETDQNLKEKYPNITPEAIKASICEVTDNSETIYLVDINSAFGKALALMETVGLKLERTMYKNKTHYSMQRDIGMEENGYTGKSLLEDVLQELNGRVKPIDPTKIGIIAASVLDRDWALSIRLSIVYTPLIPVKSATGKSA